MTNHPTPQAHYVQFCLCDTPYGGEKPKCPIHGKQVVVTTTASTLQALSSDEPLSECCNDSILPSSERCRKCLRKLSRAEVRRAEEFILSEGQDSLAATGVTEPAPSVQPESGGEEELEGEKREREEANKPYPPSSEQR